MLQIIYLENIDTDVSENNKGNNSNKETNQEKSPTKKLKSVMNWR